MTVRNDYAATLEYLENIIRKRRHIFGKTLLRFGLSRDENVYKICFGRIDFLRLKEPEPMKESYDYGNFVLTKCLLEIEDLFTFLKNVMMENTVRIEGYPDIGVKFRQGDDIRFLESESSYGYAKSHWPAVYAAFYLRDKAMGKTPEELPAKLEFPLYPNGMKALEEFMDLQPTRFGRTAVVHYPPAIVILIPDYRVRIDKMTIGKKVKVTVETDQISESSLVAKFYCEVGSQAYHSNSIPFKSGVAEYDLPKEPTCVLVHVLDTLEDQSLDYARYEYGRIRDKEGFIIERTEEQLKEIILRGETENIEFKESLRKSNEFLETVVSFSNGSGGIIFLGVDDHAQIKGFEVERDTITNLISSNVEPFVKVKIEKAKIDNKSVMLVEVPQGDNKPYAHRELGVYIRRNATDRPATRADLDEIYSERKAESSYIRGTIG